LVLGPSWFVSKPTFCETRAHPHVGVLPVAGDRACGPMLMLSGERTFTAPFAPAVARRYDLLAEVPD
jgi:hypothetical protein